VRVSREQKRKSGRTCGCNYVVQ